MGGMKGGNRHGQLDQKGKKAKEKGLWKEGRVEVAD